MIHVRYKLSSYSPHNSYLGKKLTWLQQKIFQRPYGIWGIYLAEISSKKGFHLFKNLEKVQF